jgi:hypothetical protein
LELVEQTTDDSNAEPVHRVLPMEAVLGLTSLPSGESRELPALDAAWIYEPECNQAVYPYAP